MSMIELYTRVGANYQEVVQRLGQDRIIEHFIRRFVEDNTFESLMKAYEEGEEQEIYSKACIFAEICRNLSLSRLAETATVITEAYRPEHSANRRDFFVRDLFETLFDQYDATVKEIRMALKEGGSAQKSCRRRT